MKKASRDSQKVLRAFCALLVLSAVLFLSTVIFQKASRLTDQPLRVEVSASVDERLTSAEPFGYFMGEWNLWEFIGDSIAALLSGI